MPRTIIKEKYGLHLGDMIKTDADNSKYTQKELASMMDLTLRAYLAKYKSPIFGTIYDIIKISMILKKDYFIFPQGILHANGIKVERIYTDKEYDDLESQLTKVKDEKERYIRIIDKLSK